MNNTMLFFKNNLLPNQSDLNVHFKLDGCLFMCLGILMVRPNLPIKEICIHDFGNWMSVLGFLLQ